MADRTALVRRVADTLLALALLAIFAWAILEARAFPGEARLFPIAVALPALILALLQLVVAARGGAAAAAADEGDEALDPRERARRTGQTIAWIAAFFAAVYLLGFLVAVPLGALAYSRFAGRESWPASAVVAGLCWALVFGVFDRLLHVPLPIGVLLRVLGLT